MCMYSMDLQNHNLHKPPFSNEENRDPLWIFFSVIFLTIRMGFCSFPDPKMARQWMQWEI